MFLVELIQLRDFIPIVLLIGLLSHVGYQMVRERWKSFWWARRCGAAAFIGYGILALFCLPPASAWDVLALAIRALLAAGLVMSLAYVAFPAVEFVYVETIARAVKALEIQRLERERSALQQAQEEERERIAQEKRRRAEELANLPPPPPPPPPPSREELAAEARHRYRQRLAIIASASLDAIERTAAEAKAHEQYLRELDQVI